MDIIPKIELLPEDKTVEIDERKHPHLGRAAAELRDLIISSKRVRDVRIGHVRLPWRRLFDVGFEVSVELG
jgi:hypothetical protein